MTDDQIHILQIMTESRSYPRDSTWEREAISAALAEIERLRKIVEDTEWTITDRWTDETSRTAPLPTRVDRLVTVARHADHWEAMAERNEWERDVVIEALSVAGKDSILATIREAVRWSKGDPETTINAVAAVREAAGLGDDARVRAVLDQAARDTAAVAGRERAGEATGGDTMDFRMATNERS